MPEEETNQPTQEEPTAPPAPDQSDPGEDIVRPLRTYKDDVARALGKGGESAVSIAAAEERRRGEERTLTERELALQEEIRAEGAKIRSLTYQLEQDRAEWQRVRTAEEMAKLREEAERAQKRIAPETSEKKQPSHQPIQHISLPVTDEGRERLESSPQPASQKLTQPKEREPFAPRPIKIDRSKQLAALREAEKKMRDAESKLEQTRQEHTDRKPKQIQSRKSKQSWLARLLALFHRSHTKQKRVQLAESIEQPQPEREQPARSRTWLKTLLSGVASVLLIAGAAGIGYYVYQNFDVLGTVRPEITTPTLAPVNEQVKVVRVEGTSLKNMLAEEMGRGSAPGNIVQLYVVDQASGTETLLDAETFITVFAPSIPGRVARSFEDTYTFGFHMQGEPKALFVAKTTFFENAFAGMLDWEETMRSDLAPLFGPARATPTGTTTASFRTPRFVDRVIQNKDTRVLLDENENIALLYSFVDQNTLILTTNVDTFIEVFSRMSSGRIVR